jgi:hypothetical protein
MHGSSTKVPDRHGDVAVLVALGVARLLRDPMPHFQARRTPIALVTADSAVVEEGHLLEPIRLTATSGLAMNLLVRRAIADTGRTNLPLAVILGGHYTGREAAGCLARRPASSWLRCRIRMMAVRSRTR